MTCRPPVGGSVQQALLRISNQQQCKLFVITMLTPTLPLNTITINTAIPIPIASCKMTMR